VDDDLVEEVVLDALTRDVGAEDSDPLGLGGSAGCGDGFVDAVR